MCAAASGSLVKNYEETNRIYRIYRIPLESAWRNFLVQLFLRIAHSHLESLNSR